DPSGSAALEVRRPLLEKCRNALAEVVRSGGRGLKLSLPFELVVEPRCRGPVEQTLRHPDRTRRQRGELTGELRSTGRERVGLDDLGDDAPLLGLGGSQATAGAEPFER